MPTYEYECPVCDHAFEEIQSIHDDPLTECPECRVCALKRLVSGGVGFVLKGKCWYSDGYAGGDKDE